MATVGARLKNDGTLLTAGDFDEISQNTHSITVSEIFADEFDEVTLPAGQPSGGSVKLVASNSQYLTVPGSGDFQFGSTQPFTVEGWFYTTSTAYQRLWCFPNGDNVEMLGSTLYYWNGVGNPTGSGPNVVPRYQWFHVALVRYSSTSAKVYVNGTEVITDASPFASATSRALAIGGEISAGITGQQANPSALDGYFDGYITNFRVVKGIAVYAGTFSTPISPFSATQGGSHNIAAITGAETKLLLNVANAGAVLTDSSGTSKSVTSMGGASYDALTPLSVNYNGAMKQRSTGELLVKLEFDEQTGI